MILRLISVGALLAIVGCGVDNSDRQPGAKEKRLSDIFIYSYGKIPGHEWKPESKVEEIKNPRWLQPYFVLAPSDDGACEWKLGVSCDDNPAHCRMIEESMKCSVQHGENP